MLAWLLASIYCIGWSKNFSDHSSEAHRIQIPATLMVPLQVIELYSYVVDKY